MNGNYIIDGDDGSSCQSPYHTGCELCDDSCEENDDSCDDSEQSINQINQ